VIEWKVRVSQVIEQGRSRRYPAEKKLERREARSLLALEGSMKKNVIMLPKEPASEVLKSRRSGPALLLLSRGEEGVLAAMFQGMPKEGKKFPVKKKWCNYFVIFEGGGGGGEPFAGRGKTTLTPKRVLLGRTRLRFRSRRIEKREEGGSGKSKTLYLPLKGLLRIASRRAAPKEGGRDLPDPAKTERKP